MKGLIGIHMKNILILYAEYNKVTNSKIIKILSEISEEELKRSRNTFYKSINGLFNHLVIAQWYYLSSMTYITGSMFNKNLQDRINIFKKIESSLTDASEVLKELDEGLIDFVKNVTENDLILERKNTKIYNGRIIDISVWQYMTQHITHQIHHQGQLSQILDEMNIEHEFGSIFPFISESTIQLVDE